MRELLGEDVPAEELRRLARVDALLRRVAREQPGTEHGRTEPQGSVVTPASGS
jgi:hypothetical protein